MRGSLDILLTSFPPFYFLFLSYVMYQAEFEGGDEMELYDVHDTPLPCLPPFLFFHTQQFLSTFSKHVRVHTQHSTAHSSSADDFYTREIRWMEMGTINWQTDGCIAACFSIAIWRSGCPFPFPSYFTLCTWLVTCVLVLCTWMTDG